MSSLPRQTLDNRSRTVLLERSINMSEVILNVALVLSVVARKPAEEGWKSGKAERKKTHQTFISVQVD